MGAAVVGGILAASLIKPEAICVAERDAARRAVLESTFPGVSVCPHPEPSGGAVLAVKPNVAQQACEALGALDEPPGRVVSIMAGVSCARLSTWLGTRTAIVRAMPNVAALVGASATAICAGPGAGDADIAWAQELLGALGTTVVVPESQMDAVTGLSGSGPAYVMVVVEALTEGGVLMGLPRDQAAALARQTLAGASALLEGTGDSPEALRAAVTSPAGTTARGLQALEERGVRAAFIAAVETSAERSAELGAR